MDNKTLVDTRTLKCPEPMMMIRKAVRKANDGATVEVLCDDPRTPSDLIKYCEFQDHTFLESKVEEENGNSFHRIQIRKGK